MHSYLFIHQVYGKSPTGSLTQLVEQDKTNHPGGSLHLEYADQAFLDHLDRLVWLSDFSLLSSFLCLDKPQAPHKADADEVQGRKDQPHDTPAGKIPQP